MSSILILIPSFDHKHTLNATVYIGFDVYAQFQIKEREQCQKVYLEEDNLPVLVVGRMKTEDKTRCAAYIYIYIYPARPGSIHHGLMI